MATIISYLGGFQWPPKSFLVSEIPSANQPILYTVAKVIFPKPKYDHMTTHFKIIQLLTALRKSPNSSA